MAKGRNHYDKKIWKAIDFCIGFTGIPVLYWALFSYGSGINFYIHGNPMFEYLWNWFAVIIPLVLILVFGPKRRFIALGALFFFGAIILAGFGSCLLYMAAS